MKEILDYLDKHKVNYTLHTHPAAFTVEEAKEYCSHIPGLHCKNLFMRDHKGRRHFLIILPNTKPVDLKDFSKKLNDRLSFGSDRRLKKYLNVEAGSVSPLGLIYDTNSEVIVYIDKEVYQADMVTFHPNDNKATLVLEREMFHNFLSSLKNKLIELEF